ncbi:MAG: tripartite tricarboxylate transporter TctB family protein [Haliea sp.]
MANRLLAAFIVVLGLAYIYGATFIRIVSGGQADPLGPRAFPYLIGLIAIFAGILLIFETMRKSQNNGEQTDSEIPSQPIAVTAIFAWIFLYYLAFEPFGYLLTTFVFLLALMIFFNRGKWLVNILVAVFFPLFIYTFFTQLLGKNLGEGLLFF